MKQIKWNLFSIILISIPILFSACSKDDDNNDAISNNIMKISLSKLENKNVGMEILPLSQFEFAYESKTGKIQMWYYEDGYNDSGTSYSYKPGDGNIYVRKGNSASAFVYDIELANKRLERLKGYEPGTYRYFYNGNRLSNYSIGGDIDVAYSWKGNNWSSISITNNSVNSTHNYSPSIIPNKYSIDINLLSNFLTSSLDKETKLMETFMHWTGLLGQRSSYLLEDAAFKYSYMYDGKGRLSTIYIEANSLSSSSIGGFVLNISYQE